MQRDLPSGQQRRRPRDAIAIAFVFSTLPVSPAAPTGEGKTLVRYVLNARGVSGLGVPAVMAHTRRVRVVRGSRHDSAGMVSVR